MTKFDPDPKGSFFVMGVIMSLYLDSGYLNFQSIYNSKLPYTFVIGGRGIGKTYGALKYAKDNGIKIMYMRRTQAQADIAGNPVFSPYKSINRDDGCNIQMRTVSKYNSLIAEEDTDGNVLRELGYTCALSTISNIRSFDASDIDVLIYDEFIPEPHERAIKDESAALYNALETIGRNREAQGREPLRLIALSNSNDLTSPILKDLNLIAPIRRMDKKGVSIWQDMKRGICLVIPKQSPISGQKSGHSLYKLTAGSNYAGMALRNQFGNSDFTNIGSRPIAEYKALVKVGELYIYRHKSMQHYYCTRYGKGTVHSYGDSRIELARFRAVYPWLYTAYMDRIIICEDERAELTLREYLKA